MRLLPVLLLVGCYDSATTTIFLDVRRGEAHVLQQMHNAWPDEVGCSAEGVPVENAACVEAVRAYVQKAVTALTEGGATVAKSGILVADGKLDLYYDYTTMAGSKALSDQGLSILWMEEQSDAQVAAARPGRQHLTMLKSPSGNGQDAVAVEGHYRVLSGGIEGSPVSLYLFSGKKAKITSEWTYEPGTDGHTSPGAWVAERPGLAEALQASGLVVTP